VHETAAGPFGIDEVEFCFAANPGSPARPLQKAASGGELSRVMLALEVILSDTHPVPTLVFDENRRRYRRPAPLSRSASAWRVWARRHR
jgi:DNA repair protein RecN (Recombination protein N)